MLTKQDFIDRIAQDINKYPSIAPLWHVKDPRITQQIEAIATMLAMMSAEIEVATAEVFEKTRDAIVLADMANKGIYRTSKPAFLTIASKDGSTLPEQGVVLIDDGGMEFVVNGSGSVVQKTIIARDITVERSVPYMEVEFPVHVDGKGAACEIQVTLNGNPLVMFSEYMNMARGDYGFIVRSDERERMYVKFGEEGRIGVQPKQGDVIRLVVHYAHGKIEVEPGAELAYKQPKTPQQQRDRFSVSAITKNGQDILPIESLREFSRYPALYDDNAVYLGEFALMLQRKLMGATHISVWNEAAQEQFTGQPDIKNVNTLFVAFDTEGVPLDVAPEGDLPATATEEDDQRRQVAEYAAVRAEAINLIHRADNSYKVRFFKPARYMVKFDIEASLPSAYDKAGVADRIRDAVKGTLRVRDANSYKARGVIRPPQIERVRQAIFAAVPELREPTASLAVRITLPKNWERPWYTAHTDDASIKVKVDRSAEATWTL